MNSKIKPKTNTKDRFDWTKIWKIGRNKRG